MKVIYREAEEIDAAALIEYTALVGGETDNLSFGSDAFRISEEREAKFIRRFKNNSHDIMIVAVLENGEIVGNASLERNRIARYSHRAELSITVARCHWNKGIGSALMEKLIEFARSTRVEMIDLEVRSDNERAIRLYKRFGFEKIGTHKGFFKINNVYYDADYMYLNLEY